MSVTDDQSDRVSRAEVFTSIVNEAGAVYKLVVTVASSFLGGTLVFLERIAPHPQPWSFVLLAAGWSCLIVSIALIVFVRAYNIRSGQHFLEKRIDEARKLDRCKWRMTILATVLLASGIGLIMFFGLVNLIAKDTDMTEQPDRSRIEIPEDGKQDITRSIPFGSIQPVSPGDQGGTEMPSGDGNTSDGSSSSNAESGNNG